MQQKVEQHTLHDNITKRKQGHRQFTSGDRIDIELGKDLKMPFEILVMIYYTFDSSYPKHHQLF